MIIPWQQLDHDTLNNIIESFVLREGTDYGENEVSLSDKVNEIHQQLMKGTLVIVWSELHETVNIMQKSEFISSDHCREISVHDDK